MLGKTILRDGIDRKDEKYWDTRSVVMNGRKENEAKMVGKRSKLVKLGKTKRAAP